MECKDQNSTVTKTQNPRGPEVVIGADHGRTADVGAFRPMVAYSDIEPGSER
jgi:hypothetical protein